MEKKLTTKLSFIGGLLVKYYNENEKGLNVYEFINTFENELKQEKIDTLKINSVNASLSALATKGLVDKTEKMSYDKDINKNIVTPRLVTIYKPLQELVDLSNKVENE